jgi:glycosyltransferase involved in cell wall biosynthesis
VPRVTVIIATYNRSNLLPFAIGSVLRQTFADFELLVVGDGCTEDSEQVVAAIGDERVRWINLPQNSGHQSAPNNEGLRQARGELVAYLGHDDLWLPHHLASHVAALEDADIAYSLCMLVAADERTTWPAIPRPRDGAYSPPSCMSHRRRVTEEIGGWRNYNDLDFRKTSPDVELWQRAAAAGKTFAFVPRLSGIKFTAGMRRDVYRTQPTHEQSQWLARIDAEPELEAKLLVNYVTIDAIPSGVPYRELVRYAAKQTLARLRRRLALPWLGFRHPTLRNFDDVRRFKGL